MKKLLFFLLLIPLFTRAQNYSPTTPTGSTSFTPTFRYKDHVTDSTRYIWLSVNGKWYPVSVVGLSGGGAFLPLSFPSTQKLFTNGFGLKMNGNGKRQLLFDINSTTSDTGAPLGIISFQDTSGVAMDGELKFSRMTFVGPTNAYARYAQNIKLSLDTDINGIPNVGYVVPIDLVADKKMTVNDHNFDIVAKNGSDSTIVHIDTANFYTIVSHGTANDGIGVGQGTVSLQSNDVIGTASITTNSGLGGVSELIAQQSTGGLKQKQFIVATVGTSYTAPGLYGVDDIDNIGFNAPRVYPLSGSPTQYLQKGKVDSLIAAAGGGTTTNALTAGYGIAGSSFNGSVARTWTADTTSSTALVSKGRLATNLGGYAKLASPALTGSPTAPTQTTGDNTTKIATDAFVNASITAANVPQLIATSYGVVADGTTDNTTAIAAIETACPSTGCEIFWPAGDIKATKVVIAKPQTWVGMGGIIPFAGTRAITNFVTASTTGVFITVNANQVKFQDVAFECSGTQTAGSGIWVTNCIGFRMTDCSVYNFYDQVNYRSGYDWKIDGAMFLLPVHRNLMIADSAIADAGDHSISNSWFYSNVSTSGVYQIDYTSGGGLKIVNTKINGHAATYYGGINVAIGANTVDFLIANSSIENFTAKGINITPSATFANASMVGNQIAAIGGASPIYVDGTASGGTLSGLTIVGNTLSASSPSSQPCITVKNADNVTIGPNQYISATGYGLPTSFTGVSHLNFVRPNSPVNLSGTTPTYDLNAGNYQNLPLTGNTTLTLANYQGGDTWYLRVQQDATGGRTLSIPAGFNIGSGTLDPAPNAYSYIVGHENIITIFSNVSSGFANPMTTNGDIIAQVSGVPARVAIGGANTVIHGGTTPSYSAIVNGDITNSTIDLTTKVTGLLPVANGGTGTSSPGLVAGTNVTITGTWPNQTVNSTGAGGSVVNSVTAADASLTISPTTGAVIAGMNLGNSNTFTAAQGVNIASIATASTTGFSLLNPTAATGGATIQNSPIFRIGGGAFSGAVNNFVDFGLQVVPSTTTAASVLNFLSRVNTTGTGAWGGTPPFSISSTGAITAQNTANLNGGIAIFNGSPQLLVNNNNVKMSFIGATNYTIASDVFAFSEASMNGSSNASVFMANRLTVAQTGTAGYTVNLTNVTESSTGSGTKLLQDLQVGAVSKFSVDRTGVVNSAALTASKVVFTDASKNLTSTGIGTSSQYIAGDGSLGTLNSKPHTIFTPTTGGTVTLTNNQYNIINPAGTLLALTVTLPSSPANNDCVFIKYTQAVTTVTYSGGTIVDGVVSPAAGGVVILVFDSGSSSWY